MNILWSSFRHVENAGDLPLFRKIQPKVIKIAKQMYGEKNVGSVRYGRVGETAYILITLLAVPDRAKGPASDDMFALNANLFEMLKDKLAGEAAVLDAYAPELGAAQKGRDLVNL